MTNALGVNIRKGAEHLVGIEFDEENGDRLLHAVVVLHDAVNCLRNEVHDDVEVEFLFLTNKFRVHLIALGEEGVSHFDDGRVVELLHYLELSVLVSLILEHFLNCHDFSCLCVRCLQNSNSAIFLSARPLILPKERAQPIQTNSLPGRRLRMSHFLWLALHYKYGLNSKHDERWNGTGAGDATPKRELKWA